MATKQITVAGIGPLKYDDTVHSNAVDTDGSISGNTYHLRGGSVNKVVRTDGSLDMISANLIDFIAPDAGSDITVTDDGAGGVTIDYTGSPINRHSYTISDASFTSKTPTDLGCGSRAMFLVYNETSVSTQYVFGFVQFYSTGNPFIIAVVNTVNADVVIGNPPSGTAGKLSIGVRNAVNDFFYIYNNLGSAYNFRVVIW